MNLIRRQKIRFFFLHYILMMTTCLIASVFYVDTGKYHPLYNAPLYLQLLFTVLVSPIIETIIYQFIPKLILDFIRIKNYYLVLLILSIPFSVLHDIHARQNNIMFSIFFTLGIIIMINYYLQVQKKEGTKKAVIKTVVLHSIYNLSLTLTSIISES